MVAQITQEIMVGITPKIREGIEIACEINGMKPSQFARQAIVEKLIREGIIERPTLRKFEQISEPAES